MVRNYQNADCSLRNEFIVSFIKIFGTLMSPVGNALTAFAKFSFKRFDFEA